MGVSSFCWVLFTSVMNVLAHISVMGPVCEAEVQGNSVLATEAYTSNSLLRATGAVMLLTLLGGQQFSAGWVSVQIYDVSSALRRGMCWRPRDDSWKPAQFYDWAISYYTSSWPRLCVFLFSVGGVCVLVISVLTTPVSADNSGLFLILLSFGGILSGVHLTVFDLQYFNLAAHE